MSEAADLLESYATTAPSQGAQGRSAVDLLDNIASGGAAHLGTGEPYRGAPHPKRKSWSEMSWSERMFPEVEAPTKSLDPMAAQNQGYADAGAILLGAPEMALSGITAGAGSVADAVTLSDPGTHDWAYRPRSEAGKFAAQAVGEVTSPVISGISGGYDALFGKGPLATTIKERGVEAMGAVGAVTGAAGALRSGISMLEKPSAAPKAMGGSQSMGAAAAGIPSEQLERAPPPLRQNIEQAYRSGNLNHEAAQRYLDAETLPIPIRLTDAEAAGDSGAMSMERNNRGRVKNAPKFYDDRNQNLIQNMDEIRAQAGPEVVHRDVLQNGQALIDAYKEADAPVLADIDTKYQAMRDAAGGEFPIDTGTLLSNVKAALKKDLATSKAPSDVMEALEESAAAGKMDFETFEGLRTSLARIARSSADGNERHAAGVIRNQIEALPLQEGSSSELKALADDARSAFRARQERLKADPAYKAAVEDGVEMGTLSPQADMFVRKYVTGGKAAHLQRMRENLAGNTEVPQILSVSALNDLRKAAGIKDVQSKFNQASYNNALRDMGAKLPYLMDEQTAEMAQQLGRVANYTQFQGEGAFVNNSNTFVSAAASHAKDVAEGVVNLKMGGIPGGTFVRKKLEGRKLEKEWQKSIEGTNVSLSRLKDVGKP